MLEKLIFLVKKVFFYWESVFLVLYLIENFDYFFYIVKVGFLKKLFKVFFYLYFFVYGVFYKR